METITLNHCLVLNGILFTLGLLGVLLNRRHLLMVLIAVEVMLLSVNLNLVSFSYFLKDYAGQVFTVFILTVAAAEAAIGLAILTLYYKNHGTINVSSATTLKG
ncbi:MAG: NADH-quinone oxidoreductase subunit NuoK [Alphaproteobacteria bacterium CG_4_10_14_0_8_um_filter_37_21]|nr:MAG: NADH-quinone oxidoreductase subunit NuoK [Alphaproteobacteria bacterium CG_4_10_14_0_8_um_filter_37_21]